MRFALLPFAVLLAFSPGATHAQESVRYACEDTAGFEVLAWVTITGERYSVETQMQISGEGTLARQEFGRGLVVLSGPLDSAFGLLGAKPASGPELVFADERGPVMICREEQD